MATVDSQLRFNLIAMFRGFSQLLTTIIAISYSEPIFLAAVVPLGIAYYFIQVGYFIFSTHHDPIVVSWIQIYRFIYLMFI